MTEERKPKPLTEVKKNKLTFYATAALLGFIGYLGLPTFFYNYDGNQALYLEFKYLVLPLAGIFFLFLFLPLGFEKGSDDYIFKMIGKSRVKGFFSHILVSALGAVFVSGIVSVLLLATPFKFINFGLSDKTQLVEGKITRIDTHNSLPEYFVVTGQGIETKIHDRTSRIRKLKVGDEYSQEVPVGLLGVLFTR